VVLDSALVAGSGLLAGDRILAIWQHPTGDIFCAGQSAPYDGGSIAVTVWMHDLLVDDGRDWPFGTSI